MSEVEHLKGAIERIHDIAESLRETPDLTPRAKQAFDEIVTIARHKPDATPELAADGEVPLPLVAGRSWTVTTC